MTAVDDNTAWAVGDSITSAFDGEPPLILHWDGAQWRRASLPNNPRFAYLQDVSALAANDVWGVGYIEVGFGWETLIYHWNGAQWQLVTSPDPGDYDHELSGVAGRASDDVWAVGYWADEDEPARTLVEHWDGVHWSVVPSPNVSAFDNFLYQVTVVAANDAWAVGVAYLDEDWNESQAIVLHWDGTAWTNVSLRLQSQNTLLNDIVAFGPRNIWAIGSQRDASGVTHSLVLHWDGQRWASAPGFERSRLLGIAPDHRGGLWGVGRVSQPLGYLNLIERFDEIPCPSSAEGAPGVNVALGPGVVRQPAGHGTHMERGVRSRQAIRGNEGLLRFIMNQGCPGTRAATQPAGT